MGTVTTSAQKFEKACEILEQNQKRPARLVPIAQAKQDEYRYLPEEVLTFVAASLGVPRARVSGAATFYAHLALEPKGKFVVRRCDGTACHLQQSIPILKAVRKHLEEIVTRIAGCSAEQAIAPVEERLRSATAA